jgi:hypothetical protein
LKHGGLIVIALKNSGATPRNPASIAKGLKALHGRRHLASIERLMERG